jgi:hypothetical protein
MDMPGTSWGTGCNPAVEWNRAFVAFLQRPIFPIGRGFPRHPNTRLLLSSRLGVF